ncbi:MAG: hypothetical protein QXS66_05875 [Thermoproteota archaeon]
MSLQNLNKGLGGKFASFTNQLFSPKVGLEELASKNIAITTDDLAISFDSFGKPRVEVVGDYFKASRELAELIGKFQFEDLDKAEEMERAFYSAKSSDESYVFRAADFLEKKLESIHPMRALFENEWERAREEAAFMLANQLVNVFRIYSAEGERKLFEEFADEIKAVYKDVALKARKIAVQELARQDSKLSREFEKAFDKLEEKRNGKRKIGYALALTALASAALGGLYYQFVYKPEQARKPYREAGLSQEQADSFIKNYPQQNGNSTWVSFAKSWVEDQSLADSAFKTFKDLNKALEYLSLSNNKQLLSSALNAYGSRALDFVNFAESNGYDGVNFLKELPDLKENYRDILPAYSKNSTLVKTVHDQFLRDDRVTMDKNYLFLEALKNYGKLNLIDKNLYLQTIQALNNLTIAYKQLKLPEHGEESIWLLTNSTQLSKDIVDFSPIVFKSVDNNHVYLIPEPARETWLTCEMLKRIKESGFEIEKHPEMFMGLNGKVIANAWCFFNDSPYYSVAAREKEMNNRVIKITDEEVLNAMMLQWSLYSQFAPQLNGSEKLYNRDFPWYDSTQLKALYPDKNELRVALFKLFFLPETTYEMRSGEKFGDTMNRLSSSGRISKEVSADLWELMRWGSTYYYRLPNGRPYEAKSINDVIRFIEILKEENKISEDTKNELTNLVKDMPLRFRRYGVKAVETSLKEAMEEYETIARLYPNGKIGKWNEDPRDYYYGWLGDRAGHGLINTVSQYLGIDPNLIYKVKNWVEWLREVKDNNGLDGYLTRNWKYWDLVKFIIGYERWNPNTGNEAEGIAFIMPAVLRMAGFPNYCLVISPTPLGASGIEWAVALPPYMVEAMKREFPNSNILFGPGYTFGLFSCADGLIKERGIDDLYKPIENGITKVWQWIGDKRVYLMKRD